MIYLVIVPSKNNCCFGLCPQPSSFLSLHAGALVALPIDRAVLDCPRPWDRSVEVAWFWWGSGMSVLREKFHFWQLLVERFGLCCCMWHFIPLLVSVCPLHQGRWSERWQNPTRLSLCFHNQNESCTARLHLYPGSSAILPRSYSLDKMVQVIKFVGLQWNQLILM